MNAYIYHMLLRAREVARENAKKNVIDSLKCPFCIADEDETWFQMVFNGETGPRPERPIAPHCQNCPLINEVGVSLQELMDDCEKLGKFILGLYEEGEEYEYSWGDY